MATGKVYYWIKLKDTFFRSDTVDFFMSQPNGANYVVLYQMLHLMTANTDGRFQRQIGEIIIPYDIAKIKRDCKYFSEDTIRVAFELYKQCGLIYEDVDGVLTLTDHSKMVGSEYHRLIVNITRHAKYTFIITKKTNENIRRSFILLKIIK